METFKFMKMLFISSYKLFFSLSYLNCSPQFFGHVGKRFNEKAKVIFKIYDFVDWETNNSNIHIA